MRVVVHDVLCRELGGAAKKYLLQYFWFGGGEETRRRRDVGHAEPHLSVASFVRVLFPNDDNSIQIAYEGSSTDTLLQAGLDEDDE